jgi:hypothetical protein
MVQIDTLEPGVITQWGHGPALVGVELDAAVRGGGRAAEPAEGAAGGEGEQDGRVHACHKAGLTADHRRAGKL